MNCLVPTAFLVAIALAALLRLPSLAARPMHHDEANQAVRCGDLMSSGVYRYDPAEHHGPSLYFLALPVAWLSAGCDFPRTTETTFRLVTVLAGICLSAVFWLLRDAIGPVGSVAAALLAAVSPALVYFSRFFIQEPLFVLFTLLLIASGWRYWVSRNVWWAVIAGASAGLMHATKETSIVAVGALGVALVGAWLLPGGWRAKGSAAHPSLPSSTPARRDRQEGMMKGLGVAVITAMVVSILFYSSFLTHVGGVLDSLRACGFYARQFVLAEEGHPGPWFYYLGLLAREWPVLVLAVVGVAHVCAGTGTHTGINLAFVRVVALYTACTLAVYSLAPHKTPWCVLSSLLGVIILAGTGVSVLTTLARAPWVRIVLAAVILAGCGQLAARSWQTSFRRPADERNPYAYQHTSPDFLNLVKRLDAVAQSSGQGTNLYIQVVTSPMDAWPLPWYLRAYPRVGYWTNAVSAPELPQPAAIVITPDFAAELEPRLGTNYHRQYFGLRPDSLLELRVRTDLL